MKNFPFDFVATKPVRFYPAKPSPLEPLHFLEIGPGRGDLVLALAAEHPDKKVVAVEIKQSRFERIIPRLEKRNLRNVILAHGDARAVLPQTFSENSFEAIFVLFPDPWPKDRHAFRRLLTTPFLWILTHFIKPGGSLIIATDMESYARNVSSQLQEITDLENVLAPEFFTDRLADIPQTYFEQKWRGQGKKIFFMKYAKKMPPDKMQKAG